jgi:hypothetical protein
VTTKAAAVGGRLRATPLRGWLQRLLHAVAVIGGWVLFAWGWSEVLGRPWDTRVLWWLIVGSFLILPLATSVWILHNVGIFHRKGPRTGVPTVDETYRQDWNRREVCADFQALASARIVVIDLDGERKIYEPVRAFGARRPPSVAESAANDESGKRRQLSAA